MDDFKSKVGLKLYTKFIEKPFNDISSVVEKFKQNNTRHMNTPYFDTKLFTDTPSIIPESTDFYINSTRTDMDTGVIDFRKQGLSLLISALGLNTSNPTHQKLIFYIKFLKTRQIMTFISHMKNINEFIQTFLEEHLPYERTQQIIDAWKNHENQTNFQAIFPKKISVKKSKDPKAPKKGKSAYIFFCAEERVIIKTEYPNMKAKEVLFVLAERWKVLKEYVSNGDEEATNIMDRFVRMANDDKVRFQNENNLYENNLEDFVEKKTKKIKKTKKGKSAYIFFCAEERVIIKTEYPNMKAKEVLFVLAERWKVLKEYVSNGDEEATNIMDRFVRMANDDKVRFQNENNSEDFVEKKTRWN